MNRLILFLAVLLNLSCFADRSIYPVKQEYQNEIFFHGSSIIQSNKQCVVSLFQSVESLDKRKANFYFHFYNSSDCPKDLLFKNLKIYDQHNRPINLVHKRNHIEKKKSEKNWKLFGSAICGAIASANADKAGDTIYSSHTSASIHGNAHTSTNTGLSIDTRLNGNGYSNTYGTVRSETVRQEAIDKVNDETAYRNEFIALQYKLEEEKFGSLYFDSHTVFQGEIYQAGFQIEVPVEIEKELEYIFITFELEDESHTFCFFCEPEPPKWPERKKEPVNKLKSDFERLKDWYTRFRNKSKCDNSTPADSN